MMKIRRAQDRGHADHGWLRAAHSFSFAGYQDPAHMGFRALRVINEDRVAPGRGFGSHPHRDMEIVTYVLSGAVQHRDSMGNGSVIRPGDVQRMSAGTGVVHSEVNPSATEELHMLQIWILPDRAGHKPGYEQAHFTPEQRRGALRLVASPDGQDSSVRINQDARLYAGLFDGEESARLQLSRGRQAWVHLARGELSVNGQRLGAGDALATDEGTLLLERGQGAEVLVFDLA